MNTIKGIGQKCSYKVATLFPHSGERVDDPLDSGEVGVSQRSAV